MKIIKLTSNDCGGFKPPKGHLDTQLFPECKGYETDRDVVKKTVKKRKKKGCGCSSCSCSTDISDKTSFNLKHNSLAKKAQQDTPTTEEIIKSILKGDNPYFSYKHFSLSNMSDYSLMKGTIEDLCSVYEMDEVTAADLVQTLTH